MRDKKFAWPSSPPASFTAARSSCECKASPPSICTIGESARMWSPARQAGRGRRHDVVGENGSPGLAGMGRRGRCRAMRRPLTTSRSSALADQKHCGNKSAAIREVPYKEAGMQAKLRMNEKKDNASVAKAEHRCVRYGARKKGRAKNKVSPAHHPDCATLGPLAPESHTTLAKGRNKDRQET